MTRRDIAVGAAVLAVACIFGGAFYGWTIAFGVLWFGVSFLVLVVVIKSFGKDVPSPPGGS